MTNDNQQYGQTNRYGGNWDGNKSAPTLEMNGMSVDFSSYKIIGGILQAEGREQLSDLRERHYETHIFHFTGNGVLAIPLIQGAATLGDPTEISVNGDKLERRLVFEALARFFSKRPYTVKLGNNFIQLSDTRRNLLAEIRNLDANVQILKKLAIYPDYKLNIRMIFPAYRSPICVVTVRSTTKPSIKLTVQDALDIGLDPRGMYAIDATTTKLIGRISEINGDRVRLEDYREIDFADANSCVIESRMDYLNRIIRHVVGDSFDSAYYQLEELRQNFVGGPGKKKATEDLVEFLQRRGEIDAAAGVKIRFGKLLELSEDSGLSPVRFPRPDFVFHPTGNKTHRYHDDGLNMHGPFDTESFPKKRPNILVVTPKSFKGRVEVFLRKFKDGLPRSKRYVKGFLRKYHLDRCSFDIVTVDEEGNVSSSYREACLQATENRQYDLAIVVIRESFHELYGEENPYLVTKAALMSQGLPVQEIEIETIDVPDGSLQYILNNIALACYAKLGGIPYTIAASPPVAHELVIGLGRVEIGQGRLTGSSSVVGITTIFNSDGQYLLSNAAKDVPYERYIEELKLSLESCIEEIRKRNGWQPGDTVRLVFHVFKPLKDSEAEAVKSFVESLSDFEVEFAFLTVGHEHPFTIFDKNQQGAYDHQSKATKGELVPQRGYSVKTGHSQLLLTLTGPQQLKSHYQGCPQPVQISLHRESTFSDIRYLSQQVYKFTFLSWRSFFPSTLPVTIAYSQLIGRLLGELRDVKNWNPDMLRTRLRTSRWFL